MAVAACLALALFCGRGHAQIESVPETVVDGVDDLWGVAVQPETGHVFMSVGGQPRVVRYVDEKLQDVIVGFSAEGPDDASSDGRGPLGLAFLSRDILAIGTDRNASAGKAIYFVKVPEVGQDPVAAKDAVHVHESLGPNRNDDVMGIVRMPAEMTSPPEVVVVIRQGGAENAMALLPIRNPRQLDRRSGYGDLTRFASPDEFADRQVAAGITLSPRRELVTGYRLEGGTAATARLVFYQLSDGRRLLDLDTGLCDITALAYGAPLAPDNNRRLYALDGMGSAESATGIFRLDAVLQAGTMSIRARRIATLDGPTAMALAADGALYVTLAPQHASVARDGRLVRFASGL
jgi:hypothetical protein